MGKKKISLIAVAIILVLAVAVGVFWYLFGGRSGMSSNSGDKVYVEKVALLSSMSAGLQNRYTGVVEPQESWDIKKDEEKTVKEIFVAAGDQVEAGTPLFEYDTSEIQDNIAQAKLELEGINNEISNYYSQIADLETQRNAAPENEKFDLTKEIQSVQSSAKQSEYNKESKQAEITKLEESLNNAVVNSEITGIVKSISENGSDPYTGEDKPFMTILSNGAYRIKGTINEQNVGSISEGMQVLLRSRLDETKTWIGTIKTVDTQNEATNTGSNTYYYDNSSSETATLYPFYVELNNAEELMLGQHVYIEADLGQEDTKDGIWLYESYLVAEDSGSFVWTDNGKNRLEKRSIELGEYNEQTGMYEILSGLSEEDLIAFPMSFLREGITTVTVTTEAEVDASQDGSTDDTIENGSAENGADEEGTGEPEVSE